MDREERVRMRAHRIWEEEGRPLGKHQQHWERACREVDGETRQAGSVSGIPDAGRPGTAQSAGNSGLVGSDDTGTGVPDAMGVDDMGVAGNLSDPSDNRPTTGRSKLVGT